MIGLAHIKAEGAPIHPDDVANECDHSDEWYLRQLQAYKDFFGPDSVNQSIVRPRLLKDLR